jgi:hypothetical protein
MINMKKSNSVSPFIILLIPALLVLGFKSVEQKDVREENNHAGVCFQMPALKGLVKTFLP